MEFLRTTDCYASPPLCLCYKFVYGVTLNSVISIELVILRSGITRLSVYIYMWYIIVIYNYVKTTILFLINFIKREIILLLTFSLDRKIGDTNKITHVVSILMLIT